MQQGFSFYGELCRLQSVLKPNAWAGMGVPMYEAFLSVQTGQTTGCRSSQRRPSMTR